MSIEERELKVLEYLEGELSVEEEQAFLAEVSSDEELAALLDEYQQQDRVLHAWFESREAVLEKAPRPKLGHLPSAQVVPSVQRQTRRMRIASLAAAILIMAGLTTYLLMPKPTPSGVDGLVYVEGRAQVFEAGDPLPKQIDKSLPPEVTALKTPARSQLEVALASGTGSMEMKENSKVRVAEVGSTVQLDLERGEMLVFAHQSVDDSVKRAVQVQTPYFQVRSDAGQFSVVRGLKGAEVAVVSGTVELIDQGSRRTLSKGQSFSSTGVEPMPIRTRIEWSRHADKLTALLPQETVEPAATGATAPSIDETTSTEVAAVTSTSDTTEKTKSAAADTSTMRTLSDGAEKASFNAATTATADSSQFMPAGTLTLIEIPSIPALLESSGKSDLVEALLGSNVRQFLADAAIQKARDQQEIDEINQQLDKVFANEDVNLVLRALGGSVSFGITKQGPVLIADLTSNYGEVMRLIDTVVNPMIEAKHLSENDRLWLAVENGRLIAGINKDQFDATVEAVRYGSPTAFGDSGFLTDLHRTVSGSKLTAALDAQALMGAATEGESDSSKRDASRLFRYLGLANMRSVVAATSFSDQAKNQALRVTFNGEREGVMSWLDEPGPMNAFQFYSPDTHAMAVIRVKTPAVIVDELLSWISQNDGVSVDKDPEAAWVRRVAATLGNEAAIGLDNPVLPTPNVKLVMEVLDPIGFHDAMIAFIDQLSTSSPSLSDQIDIGTSEYRDHLIVNFTNTTNNLEVSYAIVADYVIFGPGHASIMDAIDMYADNHSLINEYNFQQALPNKSGSYCSALLYVANNAGLGGQASPIAQELLRQYNVPIDISKLESVTGDTNGSVMYVIAEDNQIDLFVEGVRGEYAMSGMIPAVGAWIASSGTE